MRVIIVGGGASGLACAVKLKLTCRNLDVLIVEQLEETGKKILATGNGRCNFSNIDAEHHEEVIEFFRGIGLRERIDRDGRIYPYSLQASNVRDILLEACKKHGVRIINGCRVNSVSKEGGVFTVDSDISSFHSECLVVATGGKAQPALGSTGDGYDLLHSFGHVVVPMFPGLVQLVSPNKAPRRLKGMRVKGNVRVIINGRTVACEYGEVLFTDYGVSGIVIMNLSRLIAKNFASRDPKFCHLAIDLVSDMTTTQLEEHIRKYGSLRGILGTSLANVIEKLAGRNIELQAKYAKNFQFQITGTKGFDFAQVTCGGISSKQFLDYESKKVPNLYACGEVLDRQFACGGFNLNYAFYSGIRVAETIVNKFKNPQADILEMKTREELDAQKLEAEKIAVQRRKEAMLKRRAAAQAKEDLKRAEREEKAAKEALIKEREAKRAEAAAEKAAARRKAKTEKRPKAEKATKASEKAEETTTETKAEENANTQDEAKAQVKTKPNEQKQKATSAAKDEDNAEN